MTLIYEEEKSLVPGNQGLVGFLSQLLEQSLGGRAAGKSRYETPTLVDRLPGELHHLVGRLLDQSLGSGINADFGLEL